MSNTGRGPLPPGGGPRPAPPAWPHPSQVGPGGPRGGVRVADLVVTIVELVVMVGLTFVASFFGLFIAMASDGCFDDSRCADLVGLGTLIGFLAPWVCLAGAIVWSVVRLVRRRIAFWVPWFFVLVWACLILLALWIAADLAQG